MTVYKWAEMSPRERDALVAEKVFNWSKIRKSGWFKHECWGRPPHWKWDSHVIPHYTTDISAAWRVQYQFSEVTLVKAVTHIEMWRCEIYSFGELKGESPICVTAPEAICLAALRALGVDVE